MDIKFGTDGWRALIAEDFTFENVARCAQGVHRIRPVDRKRRDRAIAFDLEQRHRDFQAFLLFDYLPEALATISSQWESC